jgi:hypothetical protein
VANLNFVTVYLLVALSTIGCESYYVAHLESEPVLPALSAASDCLRELGLRPYAEHTTDHVRESFGSRELDGVPAEWFGERLHVGLSETSTGLRIRIFGNSGYSEKAKTAAAELDACLSHKPNAPPHRVDAHTIWFDVR